MSRGCEGKKERVILKNLGHSHSHSHKAQEPLWPETQGPARSAAAWEQVAVCRLLWELSTSHRPKHGRWLWLPPVTVQPHPTPPSHTRASPCLLLLPWGLALRVYSNSLHPKVAPGRHLLMSP